jgi:hypothetical protein
VKINSLRRQRLRSFSLDALEERTLLHGGAMGQMGIPGGLGFDRPAVIEPVTTMQDSLRSDRMMAAPVGGREFGPIDRSVPLAFLGLRNQPLPLIFAPLNTDRLFERPLMVLVETIIVRPSGANNMPTSPVLTSVRNDARPSAPAFAPNDAGAPPIVAGLAMTPILDVSSSVPLSVTTESVTPQETTSGMLAPAMVTLVNVGAPTIPNAVVPPYRIGSGTPADAPETLPDTPQNPAPDEVNGARGARQRNGEGGTVTGMEPGEADLITQFLPGDPRLIEAAVTNLLEKVEDLGQSVQETAQENPKILPIVAAALALELARRYRKRTKREFQPVAVFGNSTPYRFS